MIKILILLIIILIMGYLSKKKNFNGGKRSKKECFNSNISESLIKKCNKILINKEKDCQCEDENNNASNNYKECISKNNNQNCKKYNSCKNIFGSFLSGYEPNLNLNLWKSPYIKGTHNCYTYFLDDRIDSLKEECHKKCLSKQKKDKKDGKRVISCPPNANNRIEKCGELKPQPGDYAYEVGNLNSRNSIYTCKEMEKKIMRDNLDNDNKYIIEKVNSLSEKCPSTKYKGAMVVDPGDNPNKGHTFHFYRQDKNMLFSHKPGILDVETYDASRYPIYAPHLADRNYNKKRKKNGINYKTFCGYYCIPHNDYGRTNAI